MEFSDAVRRAGGRLPEGVEFLAGRIRAGGAFDPASVDNARTILNGMIEESFKRLDDVLLECHALTTSKLEVFEQVRRAVAFIGSELARLEEQRAIANDGMLQEDRARKEVTTVRDQRTTEFNTARLDFEQELRDRMSDLKVFGFLLGQTKCSTALVQLPHGGQSPARLCGTEGALELQLQNRSAQSKLERLMTPTARRTIREALSQTTAALEFLQLEASQDPPVDDSTSTTVSTTEALLAAETTPEIVPVREWPRRHERRRVCSMGYDCGVVHDALSMEWGKLKDSVDKLQADAGKQQDKYDGMMSLLNQELVVITDIKTTHMGDLASAVSGMNALNEEMSEKEEEYRRLSDALKEHTDECHRKVENILFNDIVAFTCIRNSIMSSGGTPTEQIVDCEVTDWVGSECLSAKGEPLDCDDSCPQADPLACGGTEEITREVLQVPSQGGAQCPALHRKRKCHQRKCPVNCVVSEWSGWSKCSKECGGGVESRTRSVLTKERNGGEPCGSAQEERPCGTESCDMDCTLDNWSPWGPCSMACAVPDAHGVQKRVRKVLTPIRGSGKCPKPDCGSRLHTRACNTHECSGDEICIAQQDLVILLDASGSLGEAGFAILRQFAADLTQKYQPMYFGLEAMRVGVVLFGNGQVEVEALNNGTATVLPAISVQPLTNDMTLVRNRILEQTWQQGFTNLAQGLAMAEILLQANGRQTAQSAVLVLSDGKYSFEFETAKKVRELKDKQVMLFFAPVTQESGPELEQLRAWAGGPSTSNFELIDGLESLRQNGDIYAQRLAVKFCPDALSLQSLAATETETDYILIREDGYPSDSCGPRTPIGRSMSKEECIEAARSNGGSAFSVGKLAGKGQCFSEAMTVTTAQWDAWQQDRINPPCPDGSWDPSPFYDTYVFKPDEPDE